MSSLLQQIFRIGSFLFFLSLPIRAIISLRSILILFSINRSSQVNQSIKCHFIQSTNLTY